MGCVYSGRCFGFVYRLDDGFVIACVWFDCSARFFLVDAVVFAFLGVPLRFAGFRFVV